VLTQNFTIHQRFEDFLNATKKNNTIEIYTDGACKGNPGPGGWGAILVSDQDRFEIQGGEGQTTNNRMEMLAAIESIKIATKIDLAAKQLVVHTDSQYLKNGIQSWVTNWKKNGWLTSDKKPVKNQDLWQQLDDFNSSYKIDWKWVRGHNGHELNERADALANSGLIACRMGV